jgi:hypothetical protein
MWNRFHRNLTSEIILCDIPSRAVRLANGCSPPAGAQQRGDMALCVVRSEAIAGNSAPCRAASVPHDALRFMTAFATGLIAVVLRRVQTPCTGHRRSTHRAPTSYQLDNPTLTEIVTSICRQPARPRADARPASTSTTRAFERCVQRLHGRHRSDLKGGRSGFTSMFAGAKARVFHGRAGGPARPRRSASAPFLEGVCPGATRLRRSNEPIVANL